MSRYLNRSAVRDRLSKAGFRTSGPLLDRLESVVRTHVEAAILGARHTGKTARPEHIERGLPILLAARKQTRS